MIYALRVLSIARFAMARLMTLKIMKYEAGGAILLALGLLMVPGRSFPQSLKCFGKCWGTTQEQPAYRIDIKVVKAKQGTDQIGEFTQLMIGDQYMKDITGHHAIAINAFIQEMTQKGFDFMDVQRYSRGGYMLTARHYFSRCENGIFVDPCNLANRGKPLKKMKTNRDRDNEGCEWAKGNKPRKKMRTNRDRDNEGCEWAKGGKPRKKISTNRDRDNEGCEWAKGGKPRKKMRTNRDRDNEGCSDTLGKKKRKTRPSLQKSSGCNLAKPGRKGQYGGRRRTEKSPCYD